MNEREAQTKKEPIKNNFETLDPPGFELFYCKLLLDSLCLTLNTGRGRADVKSL